MEGSRTENEEKFNQGGSGSFIRETSRLGANTGELFGHMNVVPLNVPSVSK
jgi:hypothetical protein